MKHIDPSCVLALAFVLPFAAFGADRVYRSVDEEGRVTYSSQPPKDAVEVEGMDVGPEPSAQTTEEARARVKEIEQRTDAQFQAMMERRRLEAQARREAREEAERRRLEREAADRQRRIDESLDRLAIERPYYRRYPLDWRWPYRPPRPIHRNHPPRQRHYPIISPNRPYDSHINTPARNW